MAQELPHGANAGRIHFLDVARALFMLLGIPFHAALAYTSAEWIINSPDRSALLGPLSVAITTFRIPGFFLIAGYFAAMLLERRTPGQWLRGRLHRLGIPLLAGIALIVPLQNAMLAHAAGRWVHAPQHLTGLIYSHLWFLPVLLILCACLAGSWKWLARVRWPDMPHWVIGLCFGAWLVAIRGAESIGHFNPALADGLFDLESVAIYAPVLLLGVAARANGAVLARLRQWNWTTALLGLGAITAYCLSWQGRSRPEIVIALMATGVAAVCFTQAILALLAQLADRPSPLVDRLVDASFSIYLFHHPIIVALVLALLAVSLPPLVEWALVSVVALAASYLLHRAMRRSRVLLFVFNGVGMGPATGASMRGAPARS